jgi:hypothetical protein
MWQRGSPVRTYVLIWSTVASTNPASIRPYYCRVRGGTEPPQALPLGSYHTRPSAFHSSGRAAAFARPTLLMLMCRRNRSVLLPSSLGWRRSRGCRLSSRSCCRRFTPFSHRRPIRLGYGCRLSCHSCCRRCCCPSPLLPPSLLLPSFHSSRLQILSSRLPFTYLEARQRVKRDQPTGAPPHVESLTG